MAGDWDIEISNVAGIRSGSATIEPAVNAIRGTNWQGKSSFITAIETALGTERVLTEGEDEGRVELSTGEETVAVELQRDDGTVERRGDPLLTDDQTRVAASLFAFLDDDNEVRRAVRNHENLEAVLTRPLDFENIDERIANLTRERDQVERELEQATDAAAELPGAQETVRDLAEELADLETRRADLVADRDPADERDAEREALSDARAERDEVKAQIERLERSVERTREKLADRRAELDDLDVPAVDDDLEAEIADTRDRYKELERNAQLLQSIYAPTKRILDENRLDLITDVQRDIAEDSLACWTCGAETTREEVAESLDAISEQISTLNADVTAAKDRVDELRDRERDHERAARRESELETEIAELETTLEERETSLDRARERFAELDERVDDLADRVQTTDDELTEVESQLKYTENRLEDARAELASLESRADRRDQLDAEIEDLSAEIESLRNRKDALKRRTREAFDEAIQAVLSRFDVGFEMVRLTQNFELVVAREGRESSLSALSEGELELLGIVACLAGYESFDVADDVPIMLLDGLGGLADENLQTLIEYLSDRVEYFVFTTYPENTAIESNTIDPSDWSVVSPDVDVAATGD
jgi:chromosome segregation ATPase